MYDYFWVYFGSRSFFIIFFKVKGLFENKGDEIFF